MAHAEKITVLNATQHRTTQFAPPVRPARLRTRHVAALVSFLSLVLLPVLASSLYLYLRASDQFASTLAFSVRSEEASSGIELLGGIADLSGSGAQDSDILYDYLGSQQLVQRMQDRLDLNAIWSKPGSDPIFTYDPKGQIEDLHDHWSRMVRISLDSTRGIMEVHTRAFDPLDAQRINEAILDESTALINDINNIAQEDSVRYGLEDLQRTKARLSEARSALTRFRIYNEIVDPSVEASSQTSLLSTLEAQLTETLIEIDMLNANTARDDNRMRQAQTRSNVLTKRIQEERAKRSGGSNRGLAEIYGEYERLVVEVEFAEQSYQAARAGFEASVSEARRKTRYLAPHINPTLAEQSLFPQRGLIVAVIGFGAFLIWSVLMLIGFSFLDRR